MNTKLSALLVLGALALSPGPASAQDRDDPRWPLTALGLPCAVFAAEPPARITPFCDAQGRVAGVQIPVDAMVPGDQLRIGDAGLRELFAWSDAAQPQRGHRMIVHAIGDVILVEHVTCGRCARVMGDAFAFRPARVSDADLLTIQRALGVSDARPLRTVDAWDAALDAARPPRH